MSEVNNTPWSVDRNSWEASGHWEKYQTSMLSSKWTGHASEKSVNASEPIELPRHVQTLNQGLKSYRDLPLRNGRISGPATAYEPSGALHGIMRGARLLPQERRPTIFCAEDQINRKPRTG